MSMSTYVVGFREPDERWEEMARIWDACEKADVAAPPEVDAFFGGESPEGRPGAEIQLGGAAKNWGNEHESGIEVDVRKLPPDLHIIRFINSY